MVVLGGVCLDRRASGLNCLGIGLIASVFYDPSSVAGIGYQLSFLATAAILFFSRPVLNILRTFVSQRRVSDVVLFSKVDQVLLLLLEWFLPALSLLIPVFVVVCPYQLAFLQDFSLLGLMYNLIIPALFSLAMPVVLLAVLFSSLPVAPYLFARCADIPLRLGLLCVENTPETTWGMMKGGIIAHTVGCVILVCVFLAGIIFCGHEDIERSESWKACL
jgi:predicted membrane metal-binding protein